MTFFRKNGAWMLAGLLILGFSAFAVLALRRYGMLAQYWYFALLPALLLIPFSVWLLAGSRQAHTAFLAVFLISGLLYMIAVPMLQVSDEPLHYLRSYEISAGQQPRQLAPGEDDVGDLLPENLIPHQYDAPEKTSYAQVLDSFSERIDKTHGTWYSFPGSALYSPVTYFPQTFGIFLADLFTDNAAVLLYAGRLMNLIVVSLLAALAVRLFPFAKPLPMLLLTVTIYVQKAGSMSADGLTLAVVMLFLAYVLHLQYRTEGTLRFRQILPLYVLVFLLSQCKIVYLPVCLFFFVISPKRFGSRGRYWGNLAGLVALALVAGLGWLAISSGYLSAGYSTSAEQIAAVVSDPFAYLRVLLRTFRLQGKTLLEQMMGIGMGVGGVRNSTLLTYGYLALILLTAVFAGRGDVQPKQKRDVWLALGAAVCLVLLTCTALYIQWTEPGHETVMGLQGRYFLPVLFLICIAVMQITPLDRIRRKIGFELPAILAFGVNLVAVVSCFGYGLTL